MAKFDWKELEEAKETLLKRAEAIKKSFVQMPGGAPAGGDPAAEAPMDPSMAGGAVDPAAAAAMAGGVPAGDPGAGAPADPAAMAAMGGAMPPIGVDAATAGMLGGAMPPIGADAAAGGAAAGAAAAGTPEPTLTLTLSQLWDVVTKVLGLAKKIGANGQGVTADGGAQPSNQDAIKAAVIEALGDMGLNR